MSHVLSPHHSGLVLAQEGADEAAVRRALKQFDPRLMLARDEIDRRTGRIVYVVLCRTGGDTPPTRVCSWRDNDGAPLPLSHGLVEQVKHLHAGSRAPRVDVERANAELVARQQAAEQEELEAYAADVVERLRGRRSYLLPRGIARRRTQFPDGVK